MDINSYIKEKRLELSSSFNGAKIIYLDVNYWIELRKENAKTNPEEKPLFNKISQLVKSNKCIFPISEITFWEIMKQADVRTKNETLQIVDSISKGISIINADERVRLEFRHWFQTKLGKDTHDLKDLVWAKLGFVLDYKLVYMTNIFSLQKTAFDYINDASLLEIAMGHTDAFKFKENVEAINNEIKKHERENKNFQDMFLSELGGWLDFHKKSINEAVQNMIFNETGYTPTQESYEDSRFINIIYNLFKENKISIELPIFQIIPMLYAWCRWIKKEFKDGNDFLDFSHASFALPYCDYFFTGDRRLFAGVTELKLDKIYNCTIERKKEKILNILDTIAK